MKNTNARKLKSLVHTAVVTTQKEYDAIRSARVLIDCNGTNSEAERIIRILEKCPQKGGE